MTGFFRTLAAAVRRFFARRAARKLTALQLPKGLPPGPPQPFRTSLRMPPAFDAPAGEFWTLPLGARAIRGQAPARLLRLSALPPPLRRLDVVREPRALSLPREPRLPERLFLVPPLESAIRDLGVARPALFHLDGELRLPTERDPLRVSSDAPPLLKPRALGRRLAPARAPLGRVDLRAYRIDPRTHLPANVNAAGMKEPYGGLWWVSRRLRREKVDLPWVAQHRVAFLGPLSYEWFLMWWAQNNRRSPGARDPRVLKQPSEVYWAMDECKEQMLIRRDVPKDEDHPKEQELYIIEQGVAVLAHEREDLGALIPPKEWVEVSQPVPQPPLWDRYPREAYLQWRTLMDGLGER